jgi:hypothetical protein
MLEIALTVYLLIGCAVVIWGPGRHPIARQISNARSAGGSKTKFLAFGLVLYLVTVVLWPLALRTPPRPRLIDALNDMKERVNQLIDDENVQNALSPGFAEMIKGAPALDQILGGTGDFGLRVTNPIPVNGPVGECSYLSRLETLRGERLLFHRLGSDDGIDVFEAVTFSGSSWHIFFLDMYHPRRSRSAPKGFRLGDAKTFTGFTTHCPNFPYDFAQARAAVPDVLTLAYAPLSQIVPLLKPGQMDRHGLHSLNLAFVNGGLSNSTGA